MQSCPCGSNRPQEACCDRFLQGEAHPETPEELLRSRYTAYAVGNVDYICSTQLLDDRDGAEQWSRRAKFYELRIVSQESRGDDEAQIIFEADYESGGQRYTHRERSTFLRQDGRWVFAKGQGTPLVSSAPKVGRNDPCPCGSGKKYKKCCG